MAAIVAFLRDEDGADYIEYLMLAGAAAAIFVAAGARFKNEIIATFNFVINTLAAARR